MDRVFIDTDIALDLLGQRKPYYAAAASLFTLSDKGKIEISISSLSFSNFHYLLSRQYSSPESRRIVQSFKVLVRVLAVDDKVIDLALSSKFGDFEDAIQYFTAVENNVPVLLTRNISNYSQAKIAVLTAEAYLGR